MPLNQARMGGFNRASRGPQSGQIGRVRPMPTPQTPPLNSAIQPPASTNSFEFRQPPYPSSNPADRAGVAPPTSIGTPGLIGPPVNQPKPIPPPDPRFLGPPITAPPGSTDKLASQLPNKPMFDPSLVRPPQLDYRTSGGFTGGLMPPTMDNRVEQAPLPLPQPELVNQDSSIDENARRRFGGRNRFSSEG